MVRWRAPLYGCYSVAIWRFQRLHLLLLSLPLLALLATAYSHFRILPLF